MNSPVFPSLDDIYCIKCIFHVHISWRPSFSWTNIRSLSSYFVIVAEEVFAAASCCSVAVVAPLLLLQLRDFFHDVTFD